MRTNPSLFVFALFSCSVLACSSSDDSTGPAPQDDSGVVVDSSTADSHVADSGHDAPVDSSKTDSTTDSAKDADATSSDSIVSDTTTTDAPTETSVDAPADSTTEVATDATTDGEAGTPCDAVAHDCPTGFYCESATCSLGTCQPIPTSPSDTLDPVCACTGVTFWNADQAHASGETVRATGACDPADPLTHHCGGSLTAHCDGSDACIADHSAVGRCPAPTVGSTCWHIPSGVSCPASDAKTYRDCGDSACHSYCEVLMTTDAFYSDATCP